MSFPHYPAYKPSGVEWLGEVPEHWQEKPLKTITSINDEVLSDSLSPDYEIEYVDIGSVSLANGIEKTETMPFGDAPSRARRIPRDGDVLVSTVRTYLKAIAPVVNPPLNLVASTGFAVVRPRHELESGFLKYALQEEHIIQQVISRSTGVSYPAINASDVAKISLNLPGASEQLSIATFLDHEAAKIDALIAEQQRLIELLQEKRQAVISHTVTKGLNPDAPMKDSGVEWLGEVPDYWRVIPLRWAAKCCSGDGLSSAEISSIGDDEHMVRVIGGNGLMGYTNQAKTTYSLLAIGRVGALCGNVHIVHSPAWITDNALVLDPDPSIFDLGFLSLTLRSRNLNDIASKTAQPLITATQVSDQRIPCPPLSEQQLIASYLSKQSEQFDTLSTEAQRAIDLLQERRSALISAAVTGQIDVRGLVPEAEAA